MIDPKECLAEAVKYDALAAEARDDRTREALKRIADHWRNVAEKSSPSPD
jgi:hypothetical protein